MLRFNYLQSISCLLILLLATPPAAEARNRKSERLFKLGQAAEQKKDYDAALELYEQALAEDPRDSGYRILSIRMRLYASQMHVDRGQALRNEGKLEEALQEFTIAMQKDPSSAIAVQEFERTRLLLEDNKKSKEAKPLLPAQEARRESEERISMIQAPPELKPVSRRITSLKMSNQPPRVLYETLGKLVGLNVVFDPQFQPPTSRNFTVDLSNSDFESALDYLGVLTKTFWRPISENTILVAEDNPQKRRDLGDDVVRVFYITNATSVQEFQEIATAIRSLAEIRRIFTYNAQKAMLVRGTADQVALAEKLVLDLDKPKAEVVVDVIVMESSRGRTRDLAATLVRSGGGGGISLPIAFNPRSSITVPGSGTAASTAVPLSRLGRVSTTDYSTTLPGALLSAVLNDRSTRVLQSPQVRASDGQKVALRIGDKIPIATGSFQPGFGGVGAGVNALVSTQFNFTDVGVIVEMTPQVHGNDEVTLKLQVEVSTVRDRVDIGGVSQPIIGQRKSDTEIRLREGEVSILSGLSNSQDSRTATGIPGLVNIPVLGRFFGPENVDRSQQELLIALVPRIIRTPGYTRDNLRGIASGSETNVRISYKAREAEGREPAPTPVVTTPATEPKPAEPKPAEPAKPPAPKVQINPGGELQAPLSSGLSFTIQAEDVADLFAVGPLRLKFNPAIVRLNDVAAGEFLSRDGQRATLIKDIRNDTGEVTISLTRLPGSGGVSGNGVLATLTFMAVGSGSAELKIEEANLKNVQMQPLNPAPSPAVKIEVR
jgi:general secretion pathway protein D